MDAKEIACLRCHLTAEKRNSFPHLVVKAETNRRRRRLLSPGDGLFVAAISPFSEIGRGHQRR
jgi:hypothetical protein